MGVADVRESLIASCVLQPTKGLWAGASGGWLSCRPLSLSGGERDTAVVVLWGLFRLGVGVGEGISFRIVLLYQLG